jgi:hypothetical protein
MAQTVLILEAINAIIAIIVNIEHLELAGLGVVYLNYIFIGLFVAGFLLLYINSEKVKKEIEHKVYAQVRKDIEALGLKGNEVLKGRIDDVSSGDRDLIVLMDIEMGWKHGHGDLTGLFADRASGVPLNELMARNCNQCGMPRNEKSKE